MTNLTEAQGEALTDHIYEFNQTWYRAAAEGYVDTEGGSEWRHALVWFLFELTPEQRDHWVLQPDEWRLRNLHYRPDTNEESPPPKGTAP